jgi:glycosyltransferase involved in cell wall biosynthesis
VPALADALQRLIEDPALRERFRRAAYDHFLANYTKDMALVSTLDAFESVGMRFTSPKTAGDIRAAPMSG